jgi:hypothetical protein
MCYDFSVSGGFKDAAVGLVFVPQSRSVNQVTVMSYRNLPLRIFDKKRLRVFHPAGTGCGISDMPNRNISRQFIKDIPTGTKYASDRPHTCIALNVLTIA